MDNYNLDEVKSLLNKNLITPDVLNNILKSATRRVELYNDKDDIEILRYLSSSELIPSDTKEEINNYLALYEGFNINNVESVKSNEKDRRKNISLILVLVTILIAVLVFILVFRG